MSKTNSEEPISTFPKLIFAKHDDYSREETPQLRIAVSEEKCVRLEGPVYVAMYELKTVRRLRKEVREV